jgi:hypothetical protein
MSRIKYDIILVHTHTPSAPYLPHSLSHTHTIRVRKIEREWREERRAGGRQGESENKRKIRRFKDSNISIEIY